jgi:thiamine monophosphate kinase
LRDDRGISLPPASETQLRDALWQPQPQVGAVRQDEEASRWTACIDNTDGVGRSLLELARRSDVKIVIDAASVPLHPLVDEVSRSLDVDPLSLAFSYGLDLALLGTSSNQLSQRSSDGPIPIGHVDSGQGVVVRGHRGGRAVQIDVEDLVFEHFRAPFSEVIARIARRPRG